MSRRCPPLTPHALPLGWLALLIAAGTAQAHRLEAEYRILPGPRVQIESWFDVSGTSPRGARVQVFRADGQLVKEGTLNEQGLFVFPCTEPGPLKVIVSAGAGHRKEIVIPAAALAHAASQESKASSLPAPQDVELPAGVPLADRSSRLSVKDILIGIGFLLALAGFVMSLRNARELRELRGQMSNDK